MKSTKPSELRNLTESEITAQIAENERALNDMHFRLAVGQLENPAAIRVVRRDIARLKTIQKQQQSKTR
jgi:large subunit ribosomal protein L29